MPTHHQSMHHPAALPGAVEAYLARSAGSLDEAALSADPRRRYAAAHVAALQAAAAVLAARARPERRRRPQRNAWVLLSEVAPELGEWAAFFAAGSATRAAAEAGARGSVTQRQADDLLRDADRFLATVRDRLGLLPLGSPHAALARTPA